MNHGPVPSQTLDLINKRHRQAWANWFREREAYRVSLSKRAFGVEELDELSAADLNTIEDTWTAFGAMSEWDLRRYTHENCPEWQHPDGSSVPIMEWEIFRALGWKRNEAMAGHERIQDQRDLNRQFSSA